MASSAVTEEILLSGIPAGSQKIVETFFLAERNHAIRVKSFHDKKSFRDHAPGGHA
jgi:hypothetical protein